MSKRRPHRKSRDGCTECRRRHIKCDELRPHCLLCLRYNISCVYRRGTTNARDTMPKEDFSSRSDTSCRSIGSDDLQDASTVFTGAPKKELGNLFGMHDMKLLHHWVTVTGRSILDTHELDHFWYSVIPSIGFKYQYVIHSVLSLSALHIAHTNPPDKKALLHIATEHRSKALVGFTEDLRSVGCDNSTALFANATLTFFYAFASLSKAFETKRRGPNTQTAQLLGTEWITLARGTAAVLDSVHMHVREGPLRSFLELENFSELNIAGRGNDSQFGEYLLDIQKTWSADEHAEVYNETLDIMLRCDAWMEQFDFMTDATRNTYGYNRFCSGPFIWLILVPEKYIVLLLQRQPLALIMFACYGVLVHRLTSYWWADGCGQSIVTAVDTCLGPYWATLLDWPKHAVGLD